MPSAAKSCQAAPLVLPPPLLLPLPAPLPLLAITPAPGASAASFGYLRAGRSSLAGRDDAEDFDSLLRALERTGVSAERWAFGMSQSRRHVPAS